MVIVNEVLAETVTNRQVVFQSTLKFFFNNREKILLKSLFYLLRNTAESDFRNLNYLLIENYLGFDY